MHKKLVVMLLTGCMFASLLSGCGKKTVSVQEEIPEEQEIEEPVTKEETEEPAEEPIEEETEKPAEQASPEDVLSQALDQIRNAKSCDIEIAVSLSEISVPDMPVEDPAEPVQGAAEDADSEKIEMDESFFEDIDLSELNIEDPLFEMAINAKILENEEAGYNRMQMHTNMLGMQFDQVAEEYADRTNMIYYDRISESDAAGTWNKAEGKNEMPDRFQCEFLPKIEQMVNIEMDDAGPGRIKALFVPNEGDTGIAELVADYGEIETEFQLDENGQIEKIGMKKDVEGIGTVNVNYTIHSINQDVQIEVPSDLS